MTWRPPLPIQSPRNVMRGAQNRIVLCTAEYTTHGTHKNTRGRMTQEIARNGVVLRDWSLITGRWGGVLQNGMWGGGGVLQNGRGGM